MPSKESVIGKLKLYYDLAADVRYKNSHVPIRQLVQPNDPEVKELADILNLAPDFVETAHSFVNSFTRYGREEGDYWRTPEESLRRAEQGEGLDCDDSAILLCSLLRNYIPAERVYCAVVVWDLNGIADGHMCVLLQDENGQDRVIESTAAPETPTRGTYNLYALFNDKYAFATKAGLELFDLKPVKEELMEMDQASVVG